MPTQRPRLTPARGAIRTFWDFSKVRPVGGSWITGGLSLKKIVEFHSSSSFSLFPCHREVNGFSPAHCYHDGPRYNRVKQARTNACKTATLNKHFSCKVSYLWYLLQ